MGVMTIDEGLNKQKSETLLKLIKKNPTLPVVPMVDWDYLNSNKLVFNKLRARDVASILTRIPKFVARGMEIDLEESAEMLDVVTRPSNYIKEKISIKRMKSRRKSSY